MTDVSHSEGLVGRVSQLERSNRRMKIVGCFIIVALTISVIIAANRDIPQTIEAQEFKLRNAKGKLLASLEPDPINGIASLQFFDPRPGGTVQSSYSTDSVDFLGKVRNGTSVRMRLGILEGEQPSLVIRDNQGKYRFNCGVAPNNEPYFIMNDREENPKLSIRLDDGGLPTISLQDVERRNRAVLSLREDGSPFLGFFRLNNLVSLGIEGGKDRSAGISLIDQNGKDLIVIKVQPDGQAVAKILDGQGKEIQLHK